MKSLAFCAAALAALLAAAPGAAATYVASRAVGTGFLDLSITTDDTIGIITDANIVDWDITVTQGSDSFTLQGAGGSNNSEHLILGTAFTATATDLFFDYGGPLGSLVLFQSPFVGSSESFWCVDTSGCFPRGTPPSEGISATAVYANRTSEERHGNLVVASLAPPVSGGVPEPAAWALMIAGFGMAGTMLRRRRAAPA